jgi:RNA polymerase sigma factor (sigma-70 family)
LEAAPVDPILPQVATGDSRAVQTCIDRYGGLIWSLASRQLGNTTEAEDAVQEIFIQLWEVADRFDPAVAAESTFVAMIARRRLIDRRRKLGRAPDTRSIDFADAPSCQVDPGLAHIETREQAAKIESALAQLSSDQKQALKLSIHSGWSHSEIAEHLGIPLGTVKTNIRRGLIKVRQLLGAVTDGTAAEVVS